MQIEIDEFLRFATARESEPIRTIGDQSTFVVKRSPKGIIITPETQKVRPLTSSEIEAYLDRFHSTGSFSTTDYSGTFRNSSYVLGIIRDIVNERESIPCDAVIGQIYRWAEVTSRWHGEQTFLGKQVGIRVINPLRSHASRWLHECL